jgi:hypothetical protein
MPGRTWQEVMELTLREPGAVDPDHPEHNAWVERHGWCPVEGSETDPEPGLCLTHPLHDFWFDHFHRKWWCLNWKCHNKEHTFGPPPGAVIPTLPRDSILPHVST